METINSKRILQKKITEIFETDPNLGMEFPQVLNFCKKNGDPIFEITIKKIERDFFIDAHGQKWVKAT